jgi:hypothetical protein
MTTLIGVEAAGEVGWSMGIRDDVRREIRRALTLLMQPGDVIERRAPNARRHSTRDMRDEQDQ